MRYVGQEGGFASLMVESQIGCQVVDRGYTGGQPMREVLKDLSDGGSVGFPDTGSHGAR